MSRANNIRLNEIERVNIGIRDSNEGAEVKDFVTSLNRLFYTIRILQVPWNQLNLILNLLGNSSKRPL